MKRWRENRTTIIITHDLAPIDDNDFVYVMADGCVVEQGYRGDLERAAGSFAELSSSQMAPAENHFTLEDDEEEILDEDGDEVDPWESVQGSPMSTRSTPRTAAGRGTPQSVTTTPKIRISDADAEQTTPSRYSALLFPPTGQDFFRATDELRKARRISAQFGKPPSRSSSPSPSSSSKRNSFQSSPELLPAFALDSDAAAAAKPPTRPSSNAMTRQNSEMSMAALESVGVTAAQNRKPLGPRIKHRTMNEEDLRKWNWSESSAAQRRDNPDATVVVPVEEENVRTRPVLTFTQLVRRYWKTIPNKFLFVSGIFWSVAAGACTPIFSTFLSALMAHLGTPGNSSVVTLYSLLILTIAFVEGLSGFLKFYCMERCAMGWITHLRRDALSLVVNQDKAFFDDPQNSTTSLSYCIVKDTEDARTFVGTVIGNVVMLVSMLLMGMIWAFAVGWELTLVGVGLAPVFIIAMRFQAVVLNKFEVSNKVKRENVSKCFHQVRLILSSLPSPLLLTTPLDLPQTMANIRPIRSMSIQPVFANRFEETAASAYAGGIKAAPFTGFGAALGFTITYLGEGTHFPLTSRLCEPALTTSSLLLLQVLCSTSARSSSSTVVTRSPRCSRSSLSSFSPSPSPASS